MRIRLWLAGILLLSQGMLFAQENHITICLNAIPANEFITFSDTKVMSDDFKNACTQIDFPYKDWGKLPVYTWKDIQCTDYFFYKEEDASFLTKFVPSNKKYTLALIRIGASDWKKDLLVTFSNAGEVIGYIEGDVSYKNISLKQWSVKRTSDGNFKITIYQIKPTQPQDISFEDFYNEQEEFDGQRIDTAFRIDSNGHFTQTTQNKYQEKSYTFDELNTTKNIEEGNEDE